jgi:hypothetical protein
MQGRIDLQKGTKAMQKTIIKLSSGFIIALLIFTINANHKKAGKMSEENEVPKYSIFVKNGYKHFEPVLVPLKEGLGWIFPVPEQNAVGTISPTDNAVEYIKLTKKPEYKIIAKDFSKSVADNFIYRFSPNFSSDMVVYSKTRVAVAVNVKTGNAFHANFGIGMDDFMLGIRFLDPAKKLFVVAKSVDQGSRWEDNLHIARLDGEKLVDLGEVISRVSGSGRIVPNMVPFNRWVIHDNILFAYDKSGTKKIRCFDGLKETTHPFAEVFNRNKDKINQDEWGFRDFAIHPELPFGIVSAELAGGMVSTLFLVRWDISDPNKRFTVLNPKLQPLWRIFGIDNMVFSHPSFSPDGKWLTVGCFENDLFDEINFIAIPVDKKNENLIDTKELLVLNTNGNKLPFMKSIAWATAPTALVVSYGYVLKKWVLGEAHNARVIEVPGNGGGRGNK